MCSTIPSATEALRQFRRGALRPSELLDQVLAIIDREDPGLQAYVSVQRVRAAQEARAADRALEEGTAGPLCGLPLSVKDLLDVEGTVTGCGSAHPPGAVATADAAVVHRLRRAGAVILGKTHLHEYALGITGENPALGTPRNPSDRARLPGGSSSGSAVSVAAGMALASVGTDTGGSVRLPAALCGLVGFKPTFGRLPTAGVFPLATTMDHVGLLGHTVADVELLTSVLTDTRLDPGALPLHPRLALLRDHMESASADVRGAVETALARLRARGATITLVAVPHYQELARTYSTTVLFEAYEVHGPRYRQRPERYGPQMRSRLARASEITLKQYQQAQGCRREMAAAVDGLLRQHHALVTPTARVTAPLVGQQLVEIDGSSVEIREALLSCTSPYSMIGLPAVSVPLKEAGGLPVGLQIIGPPGGDGMVLELARLVEERGGVG